MATLSTNTNAFATPHHQHNHHQHHFVHHQSQPSQQQQQQQQQQQHGVVLVAKFDYKSADEHELDMRKGERLVLIDSSQKWWLVRKVDTDQTGYVPSNYVKKEKRSLLEKIMPRKLQSHHQQHHYHQQQQISADLATLSLGSTALTPASVNHTPLPTASLSKSGSATSPVSIANAAILSKAIVKHKYTAVKEDELTLNIGTEVNVLEKFSDGWWKVSTSSSNTATNSINALCSPPHLIQSSSSSSLTVGLYPSNYLQEEPIDNETATTTTGTGTTTTTPHMQLHDSTLNMSSTTATTNTTTTNKCESISSNERDIEYLRVIFAYTAKRVNELSVAHNEIVKLIDDDAGLIVPGGGGGGGGGDGGDDVQLHDHVDYDKCWLKVFSSRGLVGLIPSNCVEPLLENNLTKCCGGGGVDGGDGDSFVFIRRPSGVGLFANADWYYGNVSRFDAILLLNRYGTNGDFLVRDSDNGNFSISLKSDSVNNKHFKVMHRDGKFLIGKKLFANMNDLIDHYQRHPIFDQNGETLYLIRPFEAPSFDSLFNKKPIQNSLL